MALDRTALVLRTLGGSALVGILALAPAGCLVTSASRTEESGVRVSGTTLEQITPGETTEKWLLAALGEPTARTPVEGSDGTELLRYDSTRTHKSGGTILFLFAGGSKKTEVNRAFFEVRHGLVTRYWVEG